VTAGRSRRASGPAARRSRSRSWRATGRSPPTAQSRCEPARAAAGASGAPRCARLRAGATPLAARRQPPGDVHGCTSPSRGRCKAAPHPGQSVRRRGNPPRAPTPTDLRELCLQRAYLLRAADRRSARWPVRTASWGAALCRRNQHSAATPRARLAAPSDELQALASASGANRRSERRARVGSSIPVPRSGTWRVPGAAGGQTGNGRGAAVMGGDRDGRDPPVARLACQALMLTVALVLRSARAITGAGDRGAARARLACAVCGCIFSSLSPWAGRGSGV
jgi:hypothetical protein